MLPPIDPAISSSYPRFDALYRDLCTSKLNQYGATKPDAQTQKEQEAASEVLRKARNASAKKHLIKSGLSTLAYQGDSLPEELRELVAVIAAVLSSPVADEDAGLLHEDIEKFKTNAPLIAKELSRGFTQNISTLTRIASPSTSGETNDLPAWITHSQAEITSTENRIANRRLEIAQEFTTVRALYRTVLETSIRILEQTIHGSVSRSTRAKADYLAIVAEGMNKKLQLQYNQLLVSTYSAEMQQALGAKSEGLERESLKAKKKIREVEERLAEYRQSSAIEAMAKQYSEILQESKRVEEDIARVQNRR